MLSTPVAIKAPTGRQRSCLGWHQEAALRMLMNNLDPAVAERPEELIVYGGTGKAARDWTCFHRIVDTLRRLKDDETLLVQSGKPVGVFRTHDEAPRVLIANAHLVPRWATWDEFRRLEALGLTMYGQMTAGSWIYIGTQGILQGTYETLAECARQHFGGTLEGRLVVTAGLGGMGGAQPLAVTMNGGVCLAVEVDPARIEARLRTGYCDEAYHDLDTALDHAAAAQKAKRAVGIALLGNIAEVMPQLVTRGVVPDVVTDQTAAHDLRVGYIPKGLSLSQAAELRARDAASYEKARARLDGRPRRGDARVEEGRLDRVRLRQQPARTRRRSARACPAPSRFPASCRRSSARCSAAAPGRSAGWRSPAIRRTSRRRTRRCWSCSRIGRP